MVHALLDSLNVSKRRACKIVKQPRASQRCLPIVRDDEDPLTQRIWRQEGLKVTNKQPKRGRLWLNAGSYVRLRPEHKDHVWSYDFVQGCTHEGRSFRMHTVIDEYTRECLAIDVARRLKSNDVLGRLAWLMATRGVTGHMRSDNGAECAAHRLRRYGEGHAAVA